MATKLLLEEFLRALQLSKSYQLLNPDEQTDLMAKFLHASDEQLIKGLGELKKDSLESEKLKMDLKKKESQQIKMAEEIKKTLKQVNRKELQANEQADAKNSEAAAEMLLQKLTQNF
ncbi:MAG: hypothetical protein WC843_04915 [Candidatus Gracilibacteria bacterium]|jgi:hypothetical protein